MYLHQPPAPAPSRIATPTFYRVTDSMVPPYRCVCRIVTRASGTDEYSVGTGVLVSPFHVLTSAHNIFTVKHPLTTSIDVYPAQNGPDRKARRFRADAFAINPRWSAKNCLTMAEDFGIIRLATSPRLGFFALRPFDPARLVGAIISHAGYPSAKEERSRHLYYGRGQITGALEIQSCSAAGPNGQLLAALTATTGLFGHDLETSHSQSGGPIWITRAGIRTLVGLHAGVLGGGAHKMAVLLTQAVRDQIAALIRRFPPLRP